MTVSSNDSPRLRHLINRVYQFLGLVALAVLMTAGCSSSSEAVDIRTDAVSSPPENALTEGSLSQGQVRPAGSPGVGRRLDESNLPSSVTVGAILRGDAVLIAHDHVVIEDASAVTAAGSDGIVHGELDRCPRLLGEITLLM